MYHVHSILFQPIAGKDSEMQAYLNLELDQGYRLDRIIPQEFNDNTYLVVITKSGT